MIPETLKVLALVNGFIAVALFGFVELTKLCNQLGISPGWAAVLYVAVYARWLFKQCRAAGREGT